jgi:hypothetical protein
MQNALLLHLQHKALRSKVCNSVDFSEIQFYCKIIKMLHVSTILIRRHHSTFQNCRSGFICSLFLQTRYIHIHKKDSNKRDTLAIIKSINTGAGTGNYFKKLLGCAPVKNNKQYQML